MTPSTDLVLSGHELVPKNRPEDVARVVLRSPELAAATRHFLTVRLANQHTRDNYCRSTWNFLEWCYDRRLSVSDITPEILGHYRDHLAANEELDVSTVNNKLSGLSKYYRHLIDENLLQINPANKVEREKVERNEGKTPEMPKDQARDLFDSIDTSTVVGLRDKVVIGMLAFTGARVGAIAKLKVEDLEFDGVQYVLHVMEKRGKIRKIPVRHELEKWLLEYLESAKLGLEPKDWPLFRTAQRKTGKLTPYSPADPKNDQPRARGPMTPNDMHRMLKRRLKDAGLPTVYSCHSFRVTVATDLLKQEGVKGKDVQYLLGHKDRRTTDIYDRTPDVVTRNLVERISI